MGSGLRPPQGESWQKLTGDILPPDPCPCCPLPIALHGGGGCSGGEPRREPRWPCLVPLLDRNTAQTEHADLSPVPESPLQRAPAVGVMAAQRLSSDSSAALHVLPYPAAWCRSGAGGEGAS